MRWEEIKKWDWEIVRKRDILLSPNKYLKTGKYVVTSHKKAVLEVYVREVDKFPEV